MGIETQLILMCFYFYFLDKRINLCQNSWESTNMTEFSKPTFIPSNECPRSPAARIGPDLPYSVAQSYLLVLKVCRPQVWLWPSLPVGRLNHSSRQVGIKFLRAVLRYERERVLDNGRDYSRRLQDSR